MEYKAFNYPLLPLFRFSQLSLSLFPSFSLSLSLAGFGKPRSLAGKPLIHRREKSLRLAGKPHASLSLTSSDFLFVFPRIEAQNASDLRVWLGQASLVAVRENVAALVGVEGFVLIFQRQGSWSRVCFRDSDSVLRLFSHFCCCCSVKLTETEDYREGFRNEMVRASCFFVFCFFFFSSLIYNFHFLNFRFKLFVNSFSSFSWFRSWTLFVLKRFHNFIFIIIILQFLLDLSLLWIKRIWCISEKFFFLEKIWVKNFFLFIWFSFYLYNFSNKM